jgi:hypothetical protein
MAEVHNLVEVEDEAAAGAVSVRCELLQMDLVNQKAVEDH